MLVPKLNGYFVFVSLPGEKGGLVSCSQFVKKFLWYLYRYYVVVQVQSTMVHSIKIL